MHFICRKGATGRQSDGLLFRVGRQSTAALPANGGAGQDLLARRSRHRVEGRQGQVSKIQNQIVRQELEAQIKTINGVSFLADEVALSPAAIKDLAFDIGNGKDDVFLVLVTQKGGKPVVSCYISKPLVESRSLNAGNIVKTNPPNNAFAPLWA